MENGTNSTDLTQISFPVYRLGEERPVTMEGVTLYFRQYEDEEGNPFKVYSIIDDKSVDKSTLALRRLELAKNDVKLKKLGKAMFFLTDFIKLAHRNMWFIDSLGKVFQYRKSEHIKLIFKKIKRIIPVPTGGALIEVEGVPSRFKTLYMPDPGHRYAGLLENGMGYIFYGTYSEELKDTRRMI